MDIKLPLMNGIDAFYEIRKIKKIVPMVAVTVYKSENSNREISEHEFTDYISKPELPKDLADKLANIIRQYILSKS